MNAPGNIRPPKRLAAAAAALAACLAVAACGGSAKSTTSVTPSGVSAPTSTVDKGVYDTKHLTQDEAGKAFQNMVYPVNQTLAAVGKEIERLSAGKSVDMAKIAAPAAAAISNLNVKLEQLETHYKPAASDLEDLEQSDQPLILDLKNLKHVNRSNYKSWERTFEHDASRVKTADTAARQALGVPKRNAT